MKSFKQFINENIRYKNLNFFKNLNNQLIKNIDSLVKQNKIWTARITLAHYMGSSELENIYRKIFNDVNSGKGDPYFQAFGTSKSRNPTNEHLILRDAEIKLFKLIDTYQNSTEIKKALARFEYSKYYDKHPEKIDLDAKYLGHRLRPKYGLPTNYKIYS